MAVSEHRERLLWRPTLVRRRSLGWVARYQWTRWRPTRPAGGGRAGRPARAVHRVPPQSPLYVITTAGLPLIWIAWVGMAGGYDPRLIGLGSEEFRRIINAAFSLTAAIAIVSYAVKVDLARGYVLIALPGLGAADTAARYLLRKRLHRQRERGLHMRRVTAVGHAGAVADLVAQLRRDRFHGLEVVNACVAGAFGPEVAGRAGAGRPGRRGPGGGEHRCGHGGRAGLPGDGRGDAAPGARLGPGKGGH